MLGTLYGNKSLTGEIIVEELDLTCPPGALLDGLARCNDPVMLDSTALHPAYGRCAIAACDPIDVLTLREGVLTNRQGQILAGTDEQIWQVLASAFAAVEVADDCQCEYVPGWIGYIGYEVGRHIERLPGQAVRDTPLPDMRLGFYDAVLVYDAIKRTWKLVQLSLAESLPGAGQAAEKLRVIAANAETSSPSVAHPEDTERADASIQTMAIATPNFTPSEYRAAVARCVEYIAAGDIFQVNLSQRLTVHDAPDSLEIYRTLARRNPAWYAAYMSFEANGKKCAIASSSPELFLRLRDGKVITRPIKGTRPRIGVSDTDKSAAAELLTSPKDNAELAMIIDLLRNDIGRVCEYGSVRVIEPRRLETHPTVFHLVGTVVGQMREGIGPAELLRATFPGGSITGAPKIRAMQIVDELEGIARGVYTGCIGWVGVNGSAEWNIAIRTVVCEGSRAHIQVGGGIVADSDPLGEYNETLDKARAILEAIEQARNLQKKASQEIR